MIYLLSISILLTLFIIQLVKSSIIREGLSERECREKLYGDMIKPQVWTQEPKIIQSIILNGD